MISSLKGQNRSCVVVLIYLLKKYKWTLGKALEFIKSKKTDVDIMKHFLTQLSLFDARLSRTNIPKSSDWHGNIQNFNIGKLEYESEENVMRNTYLNGQENTNMEHNHNKGFTFSKFINNFSNEEDKVD